MPVGRTRLQKDFDRISDDHVSRDEDEENGADDAPGEFRAETKGTIITSP